MKKHATIHAAFVAAQTGFAPALKQSANPHFKSRYADLATCVDAVLDALNENGIGLMQVTHPSDNGVEVETRLIHESGSELSGGRLFVPAAKIDPQGFGSALTYARRFSLMACCGHAPEDDDGNAASARPSAPAQPARQVVPTAPAKKAAVELTAADGHMRSAMDAIAVAATMDELKTAYNAALALSNDPVERQGISTAKDKRKQELSK